MNRLSDYHLHTNFSSDSTTAPETMIKKAVELGLDSICFTDHNDYDYPKEDGKTVFLLDMDTYISTICNLSSKYSDTLNIYIGVEQGLQAHLAERINNFSNQYDLDFIIGSSHLVNSCDPYYPEYWNGISSPEGIAKYFESIYDNIKVCDGFDVYGHIDYIIRYAPGKDSKYNYTDYSDIIDSSLQLLIQKGKGIEINTAGLKYGLKETNPCYGIIKRYRELGGEIITIGSDAHSPEFLAYDFRLIPEILKNCGFDYYTIFKKRQPEFIKL